MSSVGIVLATDMGKEQGRSRKDRQKPLIFIQLIEIYPELSGENRKSGIIHRATCNGNSKYVIVKN